MIGRPVSSAAYARPLQHLQVVHQLVVVAVDAHLDRDDPVLVLVDDVDGRLGD